MFQLGALIGNGPLVVLAFQVPWYEIHGTWTVQGDSCNDILQVLRLKLLHEAFHPGAFQLEHAFCPSGPNGLQDLPVVKINLVYINAYAIILLSQSHRILDDGKGTQAQEIHFQKSQFLYGGHSELGGNRTVACPGKGYELINGAAADHHACGMHGCMPRQAFQTL